MNIFINDDEYLDDEYLKGQYSFNVYLPHESVIFEFQREELINVNHDEDSDFDDDANFYFKTYEGKLGVVRAKLSTRPFNNQNAITEVDIIDATSHLDGRPITDNAPYHYTYAHSSCPSEF